MKTTLDSPPVQDIPNASLAAFYSELVAIGY